MLNMLQEKFYHHWKVKTDDEGKPLYTDYEATGAKRNDIPIPDTEENQNFQGGYYLDDDDTAHYDVKYDDLDRKSNFEPWLKQKGQSGWWAYTHGIGNKTINSKDDPNGRAEFIGSQSQYSNSCFWLDLNPILDKPVRAMVRVSNHDEHFSNWARQNSVKYNCDFCLNIGIGRRNRTNTNNFANPNAYAIICVETNLDWESKNKVEKFRINKFMQQLRNGEMPHLSLKQIKKLFSSNTTVKASQNGMIVPLSQAYMQRGIIRIRPCNFAYKASEKDEDVTFNWKDNVKYQHYDIDINDIMNSNYNPETHIFKYKGNKGGSGLPNGIYYYDEEHGLAYPTAYIKKKYVPNFDARPIYVGGIKAKKDDFFKGVDSHGEMTHPTYGKVYVDKHNKKAYRISDDNWDDMHHVHSNAPINLEKKYLRYANKSRLTENRLHSILINEISKIKKSN